MEGISKVDGKKVQEQDVEHQAAYDETSSLDKGDILQLEHTDPILNAKMHLVNNAIDEASEQAQAYAHAPKGPCTDCTHRLALPDTIGRYTHPSNGLEAILTSPSYLS